jgi:hypothetical protein
MEKTVFKILPIARACGLHEFPPVIEPAIKELPPFVPRDVVMLDDEALNVVHEIRPHIEEEVIARIHEMAAKSKEFQKLISPKRHVIIGISKLEPKKKPISYVLVAYNYEDNHAVEMTFSQNLKVEKLSREDYQPAPTNEEVERAVHLARKDERICSFVNDEMVGGGILVEPNRKNDVSQDKRLIDIRIGYANERLGVCRALVNLATDTVISASCFSVTQKSKEEYHGC